jgi:nucleotide-binding universal stress UspA family protein
MNPVIVVGTDGSHESHRALLWTAKQAGLTHAHVVVVHSIDIPVYSGYGEFATAMVPRGLTEEQREQVRIEVHDVWAKPLAEAGVEYHVALIDGSPSAAIRAAADKENADLIVVGSRGRGGFAELVLGSTSHQLAHHAGRPLVIVP